MTPTLCVRHPEPKAAHETKPGQEDECQSLRPPDRPLQVVDRFLACCVGCGCLRNRVIERRWIGELRPDCRSLLPDPQFGELGPRS
jgi:hypothetical protein